MRELRPCEAPFAALRIERVIEFLKIPTKPLIGTDERKCRPLCVSRRAGHEALWRAAQPATHESACWQVVSLRFAMPVSVDALIG